LWSGVDQMTAILQRLRDLFSAWDRLVPMGLLLKLVPGVVFPRDTRLLDIGGFRPDGFAFGIEILNDDQTSMDFVVWVLMEHVGLDQETAVKRMLDIHTEGGVLLTAESEAEAERIAAVVVSHAKERNYPLVCRAVSAQQGHAGGALGASASLRGLGVR